jgi:hypothetical protein
MKTLFNAGAIALCCLVLFAFGNADNSLTLQQAQSEKKVVVTILPYRQYTGSGIKIDVRNISGKTLNLKLPMGSIFLPSDEGAQTLVKAEDFAFTLKPGETKPVQFPGYCTELGDHGCATGEAFTMGSTKNDKLVKTLAFMDSLKIKDQSTIQHAVWCITDNSPVSQVYGSDSATGWLRGYLCSVTGQTMPWYTMESEIVETPEREFVIVSKVIEGELEFTSREASVIKGVVKDSTGKVVYDNPHVSRMPAGHIKVLRGLHKQRKRSD